MATSSSQELGLLKMNNHIDLFSLFCHKVFGSTDPEVVCGKPAPDIFHVAGRRFSDRPDPSKVYIGIYYIYLDGCILINIFQCLVFEDAPNGVRAACLAGMQSVMVPDDHVTGELRKEATQVLKSLLDFKPEDFGLPPFPNIENRMIYD